jgi:myo-inositol 2-dehydrogenase / D-chiro-inositol 1-dehydrogenase
MSGVSGVAIIGAGRMGQVRADACSKLDVPVRVVCDTDADALTAMSHRFPQATAVSDSGGIKWSDVNAVFVCVPPAARGKAVIEAIRSGVAVFIEKPVGLSVAAATEIMSALADHPVRNAVGYHNRYRSGVRSLRTALQARTVVGLSAQWFGGPYARTWWVDPLQSGGPVNEQATHLVDLCRYLLGEIAEVAALGTGEAHTDRTMAMSLRTIDGLCAALVYSCQAAEKHVRVEVVTTAGVEGLYGWDLLAPGEPEPTDPGDIFVTETAAFLSASDDVLCDFADAMRTQAVVDAIIASARSGTAQRPQPVES